jgi:gas vesicle protein
MSIKKLIKNGSMISQKAARKKAMAAAAVGAAIGVTVSVLSVPKSGKEVRDDLANAANKVKAKTKGIVNRAKLLVEELK